MIATGFTMFQVFLILVGLPLIGLLALYLGWVVWFKPWALDLDRRRRDLDRRQAERAIGRKS